MSQRSGSTRSKRGDDATMSPGARHWHRVSWIGLGVLLVLCGVLLAPAGPWNNIYCPVNADTPSWGAVPDTQLLRTRAWFGNEDHLVRENRLFLRVQSTCPTLVIATYVDAPRWDGVAVASYRTEHPELERLWPNPDLADGGVRWLQR